MKNIAADRYAYAFIHRTPQRVVSFQPVTIKVIGVSLLKRVGEVAVINPECCSYHQRNGFGWWHREVVKIMPVIYSWVLIKGLNKIIDSQVDGGIPNGVSYNLP